MLQPSFNVTATASGSAAGLYAGSNVRLLTSMLDWSKYLESYKASIGAGNGPAIIASFNTTDTLLNSRPQFSAAIDLGLVSGHAFGLLETGNVSESLSIYNPWGPSQYSPGWGPVASPFVASSSDYYQRILAAYPGLPNSISYNVAK